MTETVEISGGVTAPVCIEQRNRGCVTFIYYWGEDITSPDLVDIIPDQHTVAIWRIKWKQQ